MKAHGDCKHKFQPRYSMRAPEWLTIAIKSGALKKLGEEPKQEKTYECDVCV